MARPTKQDLATVVAMYDALDARDDEAALRLCAPDAALETRLETYRGHDELRAYRHDTQDSGFSTGSIEGYLITDDCIAALSAIRMTGAKSAIETGDKLLEAIELEDGLVKRWRVMGRDEGVEVLGLADRIEGIETLNTAFECFNRGDIDAALEQSHPDIVWNRGALTVGGGTLHGRAAVRDLLEPEVFENQQVELESIVGRNDRMLATVVFSARGSASGIEISNRGYQVWTMRDGKGGQLDFFQEREDALDFLFSDG